MYVTIQDGKQSILFLVLIYLLFLSPLLSQTTAVFKSRSIFWITGTKTQKIRQCMISVEKPLAIVHALESKQGFPVHDDPVWVEVSSQEGIHRQTGCLQADRHCMKMQNYMFIGQLQDQSSFSFLFLKRYRPARLDLNESGIIGEPFKRTSTAISF